MLRTIRYKYHLSLLILAFAGSLVVPFTNTFIIMPKLKQGIVRNEELHSLLSAKHIISMLSINNYLEGEGELDIRELNSLTKAFHIRKLRLFSSEGVILKSTVTSEIGTSNKLDYFINRVAKGEVFSKLVPSNKSTEEGIVSNYDVIETYVPIMNKGELLGTVEIYHDVTKDIMALKTLTASINYSAVLGSLFLSFCLLLLYLITRKTDDEYIELLETKDALNLSLEEKDILLAEMHHRVKNNMQVISSLMMLQSESIQNEEATKAFKDNISRIKSMALVHERLYRSDNLSRIDLNEYVRELMMVYKRDGVEIQQDINLGEISIDIALPIGLIINELVSNAMEHAFNGIVDARVDVRLYKSNNGNFSLTVSDNGVGLDKEIDFKRDKTFGLFLVSVFVKQLEGEIAIHGDNGTRFEINFPLKIKQGG